MKLDLLIVLVAFVAATLIALLLGAVNTGTAMTFGQLAFAGTLVWVLDKRP
jgi:uncharacterized membrane protein (DUF485 family)